MVEKHHPAPAARRRKTKPARRENAQTDASEPKEPTPRRSFSEAHGFFRGAKVHRCR